MTRKVSRQFKFFRNASARNPMQVCEYPKCHTAINNTRTPHVFETNLQRRCPPLKKVRHIAYKRRCAEPLLRAWEPRAVWSRTSVEPWKRVFNDIWRLRRSCGNAPLCQAPQTVRKR